MVVHWLEYYCTANPQFVGSNLTHLCLWDLFSWVDAPPLSVKGVTNSEDKEFKPPN